MRWTALISFFVITLTCSGQNPLMRMDPDEWLDAHLDSAMVKLLFGDTSAYSVKLRHSEVALEIFRSGQDAFGVRCGGDLRIVLDQDGRNISRSHNIGFNHACFTFVQEGDLHQLGGMGYWREHADLIEFHERTGEWEKIPLMDGPRTLGGSNAFHSSDADKVIVIDAQGGMRMEGTLIHRDIWSLDLRNREWKHEGTINPALAPVFSWGYGPARVDMRDYVLMGHNHQTAIIRKSDLKVVVVDDKHSKDFPVSADGTAPSAAVIAGTHGFRVMGWQDGTWVETTAEVDVKAMFDSGSGMMELVQPGTAGKVARPESLSNPDSGRTPIGPTGTELFWPVALSLLAFLLGRWFGAIRSSKKQAPMEDAESPQGLNGHPNGTTEEGSGAEVGKVERLSRLAKGLHSLGESELDTVELNRMLGLDELASDESVRAKRAQLIRDVNREYRLFFDCDLVVRRKDPTDKRRTRYLITPHSVSA